MKADLSSCGSQCNYRQAFAPHSAPHEASGQAFTCTMTDFKVGNKSRPQRWGPLAHTVRGTLSRRANHCPRAPSRRKRFRVLDSAPAPYQWAPLSEDVKTEALGRNDFGKFVQFVRQAARYDDGDRDRAFVVVIPGEVRCALASRAPPFAISPCCFFCQRASCNDFACR